MKEKFPTQSTNKVLVRGEDLDPILWQGEQWAVTEYGIECRDGTYVIEAARGYNELNPWAEHLKYKNWVNIADFKKAITAFDLLFTKNGKRNNRKAPIQMTDEEVEEYAMHHGDMAYKNAKNKALKGDI